MTTAGSRREESVSSWRGLGECLLALVKSRVQLFAVELQSEELRLVDLLLRVGIAVCLASLGLLLGAATLALYLWETARFAGLAGLTAVLLGAAAVIAWRLRRRLRKGGMPFADTIAEFKKDRACLRNQD